MTSAPPPEQTIDLDGVSVTYVEWPGTAQGPTFLLIHGLGGSWANWADVAPLLAARGRVLALDLGGHGRTRVQPAQARIPANLQLLRRFVTTVVDGPVIAAGNSMGGLLAAQLAQAEPDLVAGVALIDPAIPGSVTALPEPMVSIGFGIYATPGLGPWFLADQAKRYTLDQRVRASITLVTGDVDAVSPQLWELHRRGAERRREENPDGDRQFLAAAKSVLWHLGPGRRSVARTMAAVGCPVLLLHGDQDALVNVRTARALAIRHPGWTYVEGAGQGHTPMLDAPQWVAQEMLTWWDAASARRHDAAPAEVD